MFRRRSARTVAAPLVADYLVLAPSHPRSRDACRCVVRDRTVLGGPRAGAVEVFGVGKRAPSSRRCSAFLRLRFRSDQIGECLLGKS